MDHNKHHSEERYEHEAECDQKSFVDTDAPMVKKCTDCAGLFNRITGVGIPIQGYEVDSLTDPETIQEES